MTQITERDYLDELTDKGWNAGYNHANYALAYGEDIYAAPTRPTGLSDAEFSYYMSGYEAGREAYLDDEDDFDYDEDYGILVDEED